MAKVKLTQPVEEVKEEAGNSELSTYRAIGIVHLPGNRFEVRVSEFDEDNNFIRTIFSQIRENWVEATEQFKIQAVKDNVIKRGE